jgi:hypothetical protein
MTDYLHFGVVNPQRLDADRLPEGLISDGDSFTAWGEAPGTDLVRANDPIHVIVDLDYFPGYDVTRPQDLEAGRRMLESLLLPGERLTDYMVVTDSADWSQRVAVITREGAVTPRVSD